MKALFFCCIFLLLPSLSKAQFTLKVIEQAKAQYKVEELGTIMLQANEIFSAKVNDYRKKHRASELKIADHCWLMAYNHSLWMRQHNKLDHSEKTGSNYYTGKSTSQRLKYVSTDIDYSSLGENIAFFDLLDEEIENRAEMAEILATEFFEIWRKSPKHRENLLEKSFQFHGFSVLKIGNRFYGTHVFYN